VFSVLVALQTKRYLRLPLSAEENHILEVLIGISIRAVARVRVDHSIALLDGGGRLNLVHQAMLALEGITNSTSHMGIQLSRIF